MPYYDNNIQIPVFDAYTAQFTPNLLTVVQNTKNNVIAVGIAGN